MHPGKARDVPSTTRTEKFPDSRIPDTDAPDIHVMAAKRYRSLTGAVLLDALK